MWGFAFLLALSGLRLSHSQGVLDIPDTYQFEEGDSEVKATRKAIQGNWGLGRPEPQANAMAELPPMSVKAYKRKGQDDGTAEGEARMVRAEKDMRVYDKMIKQMGDQAREKLKNENTETDILMKQAQTFGQTRHTKTMQAWNDSFGYVMGIQNNEISKLKRLQKDWNMQKEELDRRANATAQELRVAYQSTYDQTYANVMSRVDDTSNSANSAITAEKARVAAVQAEADELNAQSAALKKESVDSAKTAQDRIISMGKKKDEIDEEITDLKLLNARRGQEATQHQAATEATRKDGTALTTELASLDTDVANAKKREGNKRVDEGAAKQAVSDDKDANRESERKQGLLLNSAETAAAVSAKELDRLEAKLQTFKRQQAKVESEVKKAEAEQEDQAKAHKEALKRRQEQVDAVEKALDSANDDLKRKQEVMKVAEAEAKEAAGAAKAAKTQKMADQESAIAREAMSNIAATHKTATSNDASRVQTNAIEASEMLMQAESSKTMNERTRKRLQEEVKLLKQRVSQ